MPHGKIGGHLYLKYKQTIKKLCDSERENNSKTYTNPIKFIETCYFFPDRKGYIMLILSIPQTNIQVYSPTEVITNKSVKMLPTCSKRISSR